MNTFCNGLCWCKADEFKSESECVTAIKYIGGGKFQCPTCKKIEDHSEYLFKIKVKIKYRTYLNERHLDFTILKPYDLTLKRHGEEFSETMELLEGNLCEVIAEHKSGVFDLLIYYCSECSQIGETGDYDEHLELAIIEEKRVV